MTTNKPRRFDREVDGILLLDKPLGMSSNEALQAARRIFRASKAGHAGSLDPLASGMLIACFGQATKVCGRLLDAPKEYRVVVRLGESTPSGDGETEVHRRAPVPALTESLVDDVLATFLGVQEQIPPMHSALKHEGKRLYEIARRGESVDRAPRRIEIARIARLGLSSDALAGVIELEFDVACSKGTYIRTLGEDIAARLGTIGYVVGLRRLGVTPFAADQMHTLEALEARLAAGEAELDRTLLSTDLAFADLKAVQLDATGRKRLLLGQTAAPAQQIAQQIAWGQWLRAYGPGGEFLGLVEGQPDGTVQPRRLFVTVAGDAP